MLLLSIESSAKSASAAVVEDNKILAEYFINTKQTHSETLMPMVESVLALSKRELLDFNGIAVTSGPGSFTGVRIAVSCAKGLAMPQQIPCCGVSTLEAIAYNFRSFEGKTICAVMDARREQVYNAIFKIEDSKPVRKCEDRAVPIEDLRELCQKEGSNLILAGDGAEICYAKLKDTGVLLADESIRYQKASSVAFAAAENGNFVAPDKLLPTYLRPSQAERELKKKTSVKGK